MKKILYSILAAAAVTAACTQFEMDTVPAYKSVADPTVTATVVSDSVITVTVTAGENTSFYGYAVVEGTIKATAAELVANKYASNSAVVLQGEAGTPQAAQIKYSEETKTVSLELKDLKPFTDYTVYAAAINDMGVESAVVSKTVKTTDGTVPVMVGDLSDYVAFEEVDSVLTVAIPFNDPVSLTGTGTAKAHFYGENYVDENDYLILYKSVDIPADSISVAGNYLMLTVPKDEWIPGAYVSFTYSADIVKNGAGKTNAAFENNLMKYNSEGAVIWNGLVAYYDYQNWDFSLVDPATLPDEEEEEEEKIPVYFQDWESLVMKNWVTTKYGIASITDDVQIRVTVTEMTGRAVSYDTPKSHYAAIASNILGMMLAEDPKFGSSISYTIAEGSFADPFGNVNNEFIVEDEYYCSYGYKVEDVIGKYTITGNNLWTGAVLSYPMEIKKSDKPANGNVVITNYFGIEGALYCNFNVHSGKLTVPEGRIFTTGYASWFNQAGNQDFSFTAGQLTSTAYVMVVTVEGNSLTGYAKDANGNNIGLVNFVATKDE